VGVLDPLVVAAGVEDVMGRLVLDYARAQLAADPAALEACSARFESADMLLLAAEAAARSARAAGSDDERAAQRGRVRAARLYARCPGVVVPGAAVEPPPGLTRREVEIARLAAQGRTTPEIAARLTVSTRTVESHLGRIYFKLGVSGRAELAGLDGQS
jgi:DNA-binding CsgD family transcriptional regulator